MKYPSILLALCAFLGAAPFAQSTPEETLAEYFEAEVASIEKQTLSTPKDGAAWEKERGEMKKQLASMLGLEPMPERTELHAVKTGELALDGIAVEKLHFQSMPGLYVTASLYRPEKVEGKLPAILYVCGHADVKGAEGHSPGNKSAYQHHGAWFARHGYVCLIVDTLQLGESRGDHHGTYRMGRWWWMSRGYTPAGVEAWNGIRALDYLATRPEVDMAKVGVTGRSGGGAYSWWIAALDDRIKVAAPTAGITSLRDHVVHGVIKGHCDCMYQVNSRRWDYDRVAEMVAPRPLLILNTDKDSIFPLGGVVDVYEKARAHYRALGAEAKIGLHIAEGPHKDMQALNTGAFAWFERWLKGADIMATFDDAAKPAVDREKLRVFDKLPEDSRNARIDREFVPKAGSKVAATSEEWSAMSGKWMAALKEQVFSGWPAEAGALDLKEAGIAEHEGVTMRAWDFTPQKPFTVRLWIAHRSGLKPEEIEILVLNALDEGGWEDFRKMAAGHFAAVFDEGMRAGATGEGFEDEKKMYASQKWVMAYVAPRGAGPSAWSGTPQEQTHRLRSFALLGQTLDGMQVWDIRRAIAAVRAAGFSKPALWLQGERAMGVNAMYASLFEEGIARIDVHAPPASHEEGPIYLNVLRHLDAPQAAAMAASRSRVRLYTDKPDDWSYPSETAGRLGWEKAFEVRKPSP